MLLTNEAVNLAHREAEEAANKAGVLIRELQSGEDMIEASRLLDRVWQVEQGHTTLDDRVMLALAHCGNYVSGAWALKETAPDQLIGVAVGFFGVPLGGTMHSHIAGVAVNLTGKGIGAALKLHQRAWCLELGLDSITWTFDPLVARNAYFNFHRLGVSAEEYLIDFYGQMNDGLNAGQPSDRMLVRWTLATSERPDYARRQTTDVLITDEAGRPIRLPGLPRHGLARVALPPDIETLRRRDAELAATWRLALREAMTDLRVHGWRIVDCDRTGHYLLEKK